MPVKFCFVLYYKCTWYISWQHLNHPNLLIHSVYKFHAYFHVRLVLHDLGTPLPHEDGFSKVENAYIKSANYSICDEYGIDATETWMYGDWFYTTGYGIFGHEIKATKRSPPDHQIILCDGSSYSLKVLQGKADLLGHTFI